MLVLREHFELTRLRRSNRRQSNEEAEQASEGNANMKAHLKPNAYSADCPTRQILDRVGDKWAVLILLLVRDEPMRFNALRRTIEGISQKMLSQVLKSLERDGLIRRRAIATVPVTVEYSITPLGTTLA